MIESRNSYLAIGPELIENVIYCFEQASIQNNLISVIKLTFMLLELTQTVLGYCLGSLLQDSQLLVDLVPVVLLIVLLERQKWVLLLQAQTDVAEGIGRLNSQGLLKALCQLEVVVGISDELIGQIDEVLISIFDRPFFLFFIIEIFYLVHSEQRLKK